MSELVIRGADFAQGDGKSLVIKGANFRNNKLRYSDYFGLYPIFAPADFDLSKESFNLAMIFHESKVPYKRYAFTISDEATSITFCGSFQDINRADSGVVYLYQTVDGAIIETIHSRAATVDLTSGSTNRYAIIAGPNLTGVSIPTARLTQSSTYITAAKWLHVGETIESIEYLYNINNLTIFTADNPSIISYFGGRFSPSNAGVLDIPSGITSIGYSYGGQIKAAVVRSTTVPATGTSGQSLENPFGGILSGAKVFVPDESLEAYKAVWINAGTYNRLTPLSEYRREDYITQS